MIGKIATMALTGVIGATALGSTAKADECWHGYGQPGYEQPGYEQSGYYYGGGYANPYVREHRFWERREARRAEGWRHRFFERRNHFWGWGR